MNGLKLNKNKCEVMLTGDAKADVFAVWSFLSFFVGLMAAIIFPFIAGLALGIKIMLWRQVMTLYCLQVEVINVNQQYEVLRNNEAAVGAKRKISSIAEANETVA